MSGGGSAPSTQTVEQRSIPEWMRPYYTQTLLPAATQEFMGKEYTPYMGERVAGFAPAQEAAQQGIMGMQTPSGLAAAGDIFSQVGQAAGGQQYTPTAFGTGYQASPYQSGYEAGQITPGYEAGQFTPEVAAQMMDPYMQQVLDVERSKALEAYGQGRAQTAAEAVKAGAFGGGRFGVREAEAQRGLESQLAEIEAKGMQQAYQQAREQFATEEAARQQAAQMGLTAQQQSELARQQQESLAQQAAGMTESSQQFAANMAQQVLTSQEAANQFAAQFGQQGMELALKAGQAQQGLAESQQALDMARLKAQEAVGREQQALAQAELDQAYADFRNAEDYNRNQIAAFAAVLGGTPVPVSSETYSTGSTSPMATAGGLGITALGLSQALSGG